MLGLMWMLRNISFPKLTVQLGTLDDCCDRIKSSVSETERPWVDTSLHLFSGRFVALRTFCGAEADGLALSQQYLKAFCAYIALEFGPRL